MRDRCYKRFIEALLASLLATIAVPSLAGVQVLVDQGNNYDGSGQFWFGDTDFVAGGNNTGVLPFALNVGGAVALTRFEVDFRGQVIFLDGAGVRTTDVVQPLFSALGYVLQDPSDRFSNYVRWGEGLVDPLVFAGRSPPPAYDLATALPAFRFTWLGVCANGVGCDSFETVTFQAVLFDRGGGDFDLSLNYDFNDEIAADAIAGYRLGSNVGSFAGPFSDTGPIYCFRNGVTGPCTGTAAVPEPATALLFLGGIGLLAGVGQRRRRPGTRVAT